MGGKEKVLTCKRCNNLAGSTIDVTLANKMRFVDVFTDVENAKIDIEIQFDDSSKMRGKMSIGEDGSIKITGISDLNSPAVKSEFENINSFNRVTFHVSKPKNYDRYPDIALLKSAYLKLFRYFGYYFCFLPNLQPVRNQIHNPEKKFLKHFGIPDLDRDDPSLGINLITSPKEFVSFLVVFELKTGNQSYQQGVVVPGLTSHDNLYERLAKHEGKIDYDAINFTKTPNILHNPLLLANVWNAYIN